MHQNGHTTLKVLIIVANSFSPFKVYYFRYLIKDSDRLSVTYHVLIACSFAKSKTKMKTKTKAFVCSGTYA